MSSVAVGRLRSIAKTVRQLPTFYGVRGSIAAHYYLVVDKGAAFIREAESLGAFQGDSIYGRVGEKLAHPSCHADDPTPIAGWTLRVWKLTVWTAVVDTLAPKLARIRSQSFVRDASGNYSMRLDTSEEEAEVVARAIEAEADRIERQSKTRDKTKSGRPAVLARLADGLTPQGFRIVSYLLEHPSGAGFDTLTEIPKAFRPGVTEEGIMKALKRIGTYFNSNVDLGFAIQISSEKRRAKLIPPSGDPKDK